ncbi:porin [Candidatus Pelagibacter ubique]|nr:porin [Candidatus Pelagibacter ubique]
MNNFKKIGLTALAGSLVATSVAYAGALEATGSAEMKMTNNSQSAAGRTVGMGNSVYLTGSGETDGGLNVTLSFELDQAASDGTAGVYDNHFVSVGNDTLGTLTVHGHGGSNAAAALDTTAAGDFWDNTLGISSTNTPQASASGNGLVVYSLPSVVDGLSVGVSYASEGENNEGSTAYGLTYAGIEGLSVSYGKGENNGTANVDIDQTVMKASYAYGPITVAASNSDYDHTTAASDQEVKSYAISYSLTDSISVSYGEETIEKATGTTSDIEVEGITASYTTGGMTAAVTSIEATNVDHSATGTNNDNEFWKVSLSFAF